MNETVTKNSVSVKQALEIFDDIVENLDLGFHFIRFGCESRTHLICEYLKDKGIKPRKIWLFEDYHGDSLLKGDIFGKKFDWGHHVAPVINVKFSSGKIKPMVIDPGFFDGPVGIKTMADAIGVKNIKKQIDIVPLGVAPRRLSHDYMVTKSTDGSTTSHAFEKIKKCFRTSVEDKTLSRKVYKSKMRKAFNTKAQRNMIMNIPNKMSVA